MSQLYADEQNGYKMLVLALQKCSTVSEKVKILTATLVLNKK